MAKLIRVNIRVDESVHTFFKTKSEETGIAASSLMYMALTQYIQQQETLTQMPEFLKQLEEVRKLVESEVVMPRKSIDME